MARLSHFEDGQVVVRKLSSARSRTMPTSWRAAQREPVVLIDAAAEPERLLASAADLRLSAILTTHGHRDHVQGVAGVREQADVPFRIHSADAERCGHVPDEALREGVVPVGDIAIAAVETPGDTAGSMCFAVPGIVFSGDTLFPGGPGATEDGTAFGTILESISDRLFTLDADTLVMPGHGLDTTIGAERPYLEEWRARGLVKRATSHGGDRCNLA